MGDKKKRQSTAEGWRDPLFASGFSVNPAIGPTERDDPKLAKVTRAPRRTERIDWSEVADFLSQ